MESLALHGFTNRDNLDSHIESLLAAADRQLDQACVVRTTAD
jgi:hypothetical protein